MTNQKVKALNVIATLFAVVYIILFFVYFWVQANLLDAQIKLLQTKIEIVRQEAKECP